MNGKRSELFSATPSLEEQHIACVELFTIQCNTCMVTTCALHACTNRPIDTFR